MPNITTMAGTDLLDMSGAVITTMLEDVDVGTATFQVTASGTAPISYQWQKSTDDGSTWNNIDGAVGSTLQVPDNSTDLYRVIVSNECGSVTSNSVQVIPL